jgi:hypothetical protein
MLNKKSIKQKKLMEVCHDFHSVAFMFLFQVEVVAQEKYKKVIQEFKPQILQLLARQLIV